VALSLALTTLTIGCARIDRTSTKTSPRPAHVLKIGVIAPLDAGLTSFGRGIRNSVQLAVDGANARHPIPGWSLEVAAKDDSSDPVTGARSATSLAMDDAVVGVVGTYNSGVAMKVAPIMSAAGLAMISPANTDPSLTLGPDRSAPRRPFKTYFRLVATDAQQGPFLATYARNRLNARTVAVVSETKPVSRGLADDFLASFEKAGGHVVFNKTVPDATTDFSAVVDAITPLQPDLIFFGGEYQIAAALRSAAANIAVPLMGGDGIKDDAYIKAVGARAERDLASTVGAPVATEKSAASFRDLYNAAHFSEASTDYGPYAYDAANLVIEAARAALAGQHTLPTDIRTKIVDNVQRARVEGASGLIAFDNFGDTVTKVLTIYRVDHGAWTPELTATVR
jgi:branched-chain amino acid transport system substrate-binding protein